MRRRALSLIVVTLLLGACGGGGGDDPAVEAKADVGADTRGDATAGTAAGAGSAFGSQECKDAVAAMTAAGAGLAQLGTGAGDVGASAKKFADVADVAPKEIRADMQLLAEAYTEIAKAFADVDLSSGAAPSAETQKKLETLGKRFEGSDFTNASKRVSAFFTKTCGANP